jgi:hypothetical protein
MEEIVVPITKNKAAVVPEVSDIRLHWSRIKPGIEQILEENPQLTYLPEDVYSECVNGRATLFTSPIGFLVLTTEVDQFTGAKTLLIWIAYTYNQGKHNWLDHADWFDNLAQHLGYRTIEARSAVSEMEEYALNNGWSLDTIVYTREVPYGE